ncbi:MAG: hypothetical protein WBL77_07995, partial [Pseudolabrys sp.]
YRRRYRAAPGAVQPGQFTAQRLDAPRFARQVAERELKSPPRAHCTEIPQSIPRVPGKLRNLFLVVSHYAVVIARRR